MRTPGKQCGLAATGDYQPSLRSPWLAANDYNLNISRYVSTAKPEPIVDLQTVNKELLAIDETVRNATQKHNQFLEELGLPPIV